jgi:uncharacterized membrane protein YdbT with pleckstrin-like domain
MVSVKKLLSEDENILKQAHPFIGILFVPLVVFVVFLAGALIGVYFLPKNAPVYEGIALGIPSFIALLWIVIRAVRRLGYSFIVTNFRLIESTGLLSKNIRDIPIKNIQSITIKQSIFQRLTKTGTLVVQAAGAAPDSDEQFSHLPRIDETYRTINQLMNG